MRNFIDNNENTPEIVPTVTEATATLEDLHRQKRDAEAILAELNVFFEKYALKASTGDSAARGNVERIEKDIFSAEMKLKRATVSIPAQELVLEKARSVEAANLAKADADSARTIASSMAPFGVEMDLALEAFLASFRKYQVASIQMEALGYAPYNHLGLVIQAQLARVLQGEGFTALDPYYPPERGQSFEKILAELVPFTERKISETLNPKKIVEAPAPEVEPARNVWQPNKGALSGLRSFGDIGDTGGLV